MNCYEHPDVISVATCACGRGLCGTCQGKHQPPTCEPCYGAAVTKRIAKTQQRLVINCIFAVGYLITALEMLTHTTGNTVVMLMDLAWGFLGFRWLLDGLLGSTGLTVFASGRSWFITYFIGSLLCSLAGFIVVPVEIALQWRLLKRLKAEAAGAPHAPAVAIGTAS